MLIDTSVFEDIQTNLQSLSIDDIKQRLQHLLPGMSVTAPIIPSGTYLYRGRLFGEDFSKARVTYSDLIYPPAHKARAGRVNRAADPIFYCSVGKEPVFFELDGLTAGSEILMSFWQTTEQMIVNNVGYTQSAFDFLGAKRPCPTWSPEKSGNPASSGTVSVPTVSREQFYARLDTGPNHELRRAMSELFACRVAPSETAKYKLTVAIAELHLGSLVNYREPLIPLGQREFAGLLYPSIGMWGNADNLALKPWFVDGHLNFLKAVHIRIDSYVLDDAGRGSGHITALDCASEFGDDESLCWLGRMPSWTLQPKQGAKFQGVPGRYSDGDYELDANGNPCHWMAVDIETGEPLKLA